MQTSKTTWLYKGNRYTWPQLLALLILSGALSACSTTQPALNYSDSRLVTDSAERSACMLQVIHQEQQQQRARDQYRDNEQFLRDARERHLRTCRQIGMEC
jgi:outer membrane PBP1 activator LpoA protein